MANTDKVVGLGLTFDDVLLLPGYSETTPDQVDVSSLLTPSIRLNIPILSAAMDTVTGSDMAIAMARQGGAGVVHKNMSIHEQAYLIGKVKKSESGMIDEPVTINPRDTVADALNQMAEYRISGLPVVEHGELVGILTNRDVRFVTDPSKVLVSEVMTTREKGLVTVPEGTSLDEAKEHLHAARIEKLLVVNADNKLCGLITIKDIEKKGKYPNSCKDDKGRLRVGGALGVGADREERAQALINAGVDFLVIDSAHGHSKNVLDTIRDVKTAFPSAQIVGGNIATYDGAKALIDAGADCVKIGIGPGSICTTRIVAGVGVPQVTAIMEAVRACRENDRTCIADGGIKFSGDIAKAIAAGADTVMVGGMLAGTEESPGETVLYQGRTYKIYRGMGSIDAMKDGSGDRYFQDKKKAEKLVPEGIVGRVPYKGPVADNLYQLVGGLKSGMGYCGCGSIPELQDKARFTRISAAGLRESHVHDVIITKEAPNYNVEKI